MANDSIASSTSGFLTKAIPSLIILDGISALLIGILYFFHIYMTDYFSDDQTIGVMARQQANFVVQLMFAYLVICVISLIYARKRKLFGTIVLACLAVLHTSGVVLLRIVNSHLLMTDFLAPFMYASLFINLLLLFLVFRNDISTVMKTG